VLIVGLTGGIATGKSTVTAIFERLGAFIFDFDVAAHEVVEPDKPAWKDIVEYFGEAVLNDDRSLNRAKLGDIVFPDPEERKKLQGFIYPRLFEEYSRRIGEIKQQDPNALVVADTPVLFEAHLEGMFDKILVVYATREQQIQRLTERDGLARDAVLTRVEAQMPTEEKVERADYVIHNCDSIEDIEREVTRLFAELQKMAQEKS
jgi:dephospho-CoA kinase